MNISSFLLEEKYRPETFDELVLPKLYEPIVKGMIADGMAQNMLICGKAGCGKTSLGYILAAETNASVMYINASLDMTVDTIRNKILGHCTKNSVDNKSYKIIILDEIDHPRAKDLQKSILSIMEKYSSGTRFVLTCNSKSKIDKALVSRCREIDFVFDQSETKTAKKKFISRLLDILKAENIAYDIEAVAMLVEMKFPDMRKILNIVDFVSKSGKITKENTVSSMYYDVDQFFAMLRSKDYAAVKKYVQVMNISVDDFYSLMFNNIEHHIDAIDIPCALMTTYDFLKDASIVNDTFINICAYSLKMMEFKHRIA